MKKTPMILFALLFLAVGSAAQAKRTTDTEPDCLAVNGSWLSVNNSNWREFCVLPAREQSECAQQEGDWVLHGVPPNDGWRCESQPSQEGIAQQCRDKGGTFDTQGFCMIGSEERQCLVENGTWQRMGLQRKFGCIRPAADTGKPCKDRADCQFGCVYEGPRPIPKENATGTCQATDNPFGCRYRVKEGKVSGRICVD